LLRLTARKRGADTLGMMADSIVCCRPTGLSRRAGLWCTLLLILAVIAMRGPALFRVGLWRDEAATYLYATAPTPGAFIDLIRHVEANPPGFFYLMFVWVHAFGSAPAVLKLPIFAFSLVLIWLTYELGQRLHSPRVGLCAAVLIAVAPISTFVSIQGRAYALAACLCTLIVLLYERACADPTPRRLSWLALVAAAALYVHYTAIPFLVAIGIVTAARPRLAPATRLRVLLALVASLLPFTIWIPSLIAQARAGSAIQDYLSAADAFELFVRHFVSLLPGWSTLEMALAGLVATITLVRMRAGHSPAIPTHALIIGILTAAFIAALNLSADRYIHPFAPLLIVCATAYAADASLCLSSYGKLASVTARWLVPLATLYIALIQIPLDARLLFVTFSGVPALVAEAKKTPSSTFYVLAPDYIASTFLYYDRSYGKPSLRFDAFARQDRPELYRFFDNYGELWSSADLIRRSERRYLRDASGSRFLALVVEGDPPQTGSLPVRSRCDELLADLRLHLKEVDRREYPGTVEPLVVYRFLLPAQFARRQSTAIPGEIARKRSVGT
jgi:hypothetical protein